MNKAVKKSVFVFAIISVVVAMAVMLVGCNKVDKKLQSMQNSISYYNSQMLVAEDSNFYVEVVGGERELSLIHI